MKAIPTPTLEHLDKLTTYIDASPGPGCCWEWQRGKDSDGYGRLKIDGIEFKTHRLALQWLGGEVLEDTDLVCHSCDNPSCCNPEHLSKGTPQSNTRERDERGRVSQGDDHWTRLFPEKVLRGDQHSSRTRPECRPRGDIHWTRTNPDKLRRGEDHGNSRISDFDRETIKRLWTNGAIAKWELAQKFGYTISGIANIVKGIKPVIKPPRKNRTKGS